MRREIESVLVSRFIRDLATFRPRTGHVFQGNEWPWFGCYVATSSCHVRPFNAPASSKEAERKHLGHSPSSKPIQKPILRRSRFREILINCLLLSLSAYCIFRKPSPHRPMRMKTSIAGKVIFDEPVTGLTPVVMVRWEGDFLTRTQKVILTNIRSMHWHAQTPKDSLGWVW